MGLSFVPQNIMEPFQATHVQALIEGLIVHQVAVPCGVDKNTFFRFQHRYLDPYGPSHSTEIVWNCRSGQKPTSYCP